MSQVSAKLVQLGAKRDSLDRAGRSSVKVTLTRCPVLVSESGLSSGLLCPPLGIAYVAAAAREHGYSVSIVDPVGEAVQDREGPQTRPGGSRQ